MERYLPLKPNMFMRVTDDESHIKFVPEQGFLWPITTHSLDLCYRIAPSKVINHLLWTRGNEWTGLFSLCATTERKTSEVDWRLRDRHSGIKVWYIDTSELTWRSACWNSCTFINYLSDYDNKVMIFKATELIDKFGLMANVSEMDRIVLLAARDEWFALEWIPSGMVIHVERLS